MDLYLGWAFLLGGFSAISLLLGSLCGILLPPKRAWVGVLAAFGAGALIAALSLELVAPTLFRSDTIHRNLHVSLLIGGSMIGGMLFTLLDRMINSHGGFLRKTASTIAFFSKKKKNDTLAVLQKLGSIEILRKVPTAHIHQLIRYVRPVSFQSGDQLFDQGEIGDRLYFIQSGEITIERNGEAIKQLRAGDVLGEISLLSGGTRTARAIAKTESETLVILKDDFDLIRQKSSEFNQAVHELAENRVVELREIEARSIRDGKDWANDMINEINEGHRLPTLAELHTAREEHDNAPLAIWLGILLDGIPESLVIGMGLFAQVSFYRTAGIDVPLEKVVPYTLIAGLFLSNFPESLSSSVGMKAQGWSSRKIIVMWASLVIMTAVGSALGYALGQSFSQEFVIAVEGVAAGAMLTMIASAMIPEAVHLGGQHLVGLSTLLGFLAAVGFKLLE